LNDSKPQIRNPKLEIGPAPELVVWFNLQLRISDLRFAIFRFPYQNFTSGGFSAPASAVKYTFG
jgi:hypothetical protein